ncbi:MAG TPA: DASH family cryptochrome [Methylovorus sp.]|nr:DASH family cryptochrome [Methylovorus sp.]
MRPQPLPRGVIFWFRRDLRLHDQPALTAAIQHAEQQGGWLLPVFVHDPAEGAQTRWGFARMSDRRRAWLASAAHALAGELHERASGLLQCEGDTVATLLQLVGALGNPLLVCEEIAAPEEQAVVEALRAAGVEVHTVWQSSLVAPADLPFEPRAVPDTFTTFRQALERAHVQAAQPLPPVVSLPALPPDALLNLVKPNSFSAEHRIKTNAGDSAPASPAYFSDARAAFPTGPGRFTGGERSALQHLARYCQRGLPHTYKTTRNGLMGVDYSSKWSPWLATGALSARQAWASIQAFEAEHGANESTYWLWFELLWRDHFRWLHFKHGRKLYRAGGLGNAPAPSHYAENFARWCRGETGQPFIDAGMHELAATGYLSNRLRQNVASYLVHDLGCDWGAGAAWFEAQLLDYDVYSNQGNWLYLSGRGTDPRQGRRFNPDKQAQDYDADGRYRALWGPVP